jgi:hypothetical protein
MSCRRYLYRGVDRYDPVGYRDQSGTVGDEHDRASHGQARDRTHDLALGLAVEVGGRLVEQQQRNVAQERARER